WDDATQKAPRSAMVQRQLADAFATASRVAAGRESSSLAADAAPCGAAASTPRREETELAERATEAWRTARTLASPDLDRLRADEGLATQLFVTASSAKDAAAQITEAVARYESAESYASKVDVPGIREDVVKILCNRASCRELLGDTEKALADWKEAAQSD